MITFSKLGKLGRLGNQMFQIASTIGVATKCGQAFSFPVWEYSKHFENQLPQNGSGFKNTKTLEEVNSYYYDYNLPSNHNYDLNGYFQSWKYFDHCQDLIRHYFTPNFRIKSLIADVAIHVRRGDYLSMEHRHPVLGMDYYEKAMKMFPRSKFIVFSDDINWCQKNFKGDNTVFAYPKTDIHDLIHMSKYKHQIIGNSSFSWWAAWLNTNKDKVVVAPKNYVVGETKDDRIPPEWKKI